MLKWTEIPIEFSKGRVVVDEDAEALQSKALAIYKSDDCVVITVDLDSKYAEICAITESEIWLAATENTMHINESANPDEMTRIAFLGLEGWTYWCGEISKYSLSVCYIRDMPEEDDRV